MQTIAAQQVETAGQYRIEVFKGGRWRHAWTAEELSSARWVAESMLRGFLAVRVLDAAGKYVFESWAGSEEAQP